MPVLEHSSLPADISGNIFAVTGAVGSMLRSCRMGSKADGLYEEVKATKSYAAALLVCARYVDMTEWAEANGRDPETMEPA